MAYTWYVSHSQSSSENACSAAINEAYYTVEAAWNSLNRFFFDTGYTLVYTGETLGEWVGYNSTNTTPAYSAVIFNINGDLSGFTECSSGETTTTTTTTVTGTTTTTTTAAPGTTTSTTTTTAVPASIQIQPATGLVFTRSPVIFRYENCTFQRTYLFNLYMSMTTTINTIYTSVERIPDVDLTVTIDASNVMSNYIRNNMTGPYNQTWAYYRAELIEYSGTTSGATIVSNSGICLMGYSTIGLTAFDEINVNPINYVGSGDTFMASLSPNITNKIYNTYYIVAYENTYLYIFKKNATKYTIDYTSGSSGDVTLNTGINKIQILNSGVNMSYPITYKIYNGGTLLKTFVFQYDESCKDLNSGIVSFVFLNKWGVWQPIQFRGRIDTELTTTSETFKYNKVNWSAIPTWYKSTYHKSNVQGKNKIIVNTGWLDEVTNVTIQELFLSEYVYIFNTISSSYTNVILADTNVKYKTDRWDKLINYTLIFDESFDKINNIK